MCDANCSFVGVTIKHIGITHDNVAFTDSRLLEQVREIELAYHLVDDNAYYDSDFMMTPSSCNQFLKLFMHY
jgi:hypothetical protein